MSDVIRLNAEDAEMVKNEFRLGAGEKKNCPERQAVLQWATAPESEKHR